MAEDTHGNGHQLQRQVAVGDVDCKENAVGSQNRITLQAQVRGRICVSVP